MVPMGLWTVVLAAMVGALVATTVGLLLFRSYQKGERGRYMVAQILPDGVVQSLEALPFPAFVVNASNEVLLTTPSLKPLGIVSGRRVVLDEITHDIDQVRETGTAVQQELVLRRGRGDRADSHVTTHVSVLGNRYILVVVEDRTQEVLVEAMRRDFTTNVSHELKTPIAAVLLLSEALADSADDPEMVGRFARQLRSETQRLSDMVGDILSLSRIESELDQRTQFSDVDLTGVVDAAIATAQVTAQRKGVSLSARTEGDLRIEGDEKSLVSAVANLLTNAIEYSPQGSDVGVLASGRDDGVSIVVTDKGEGISKAQQARIFERFYRVDPARVRSTGTGGTGLGLSIVKHVARTHGGTVSVWSRVGIGSSFTLNLPRSGDLTGQVIGTDRETPTAAPVVVRQP